MENKLKKVNVFVEYHNSDNELTFAVMCMAFLKKGTLYCIRTSCASGPKFFTISLSDTTQHENDPDFFLTVSDSVGLNDSRIHPKAFSEHLKQELNDAWQEEMRSFRETYCNAH